MEEFISVLTAFISNCGFPIFACVMMFVQNNRLQDTLTKNTEALGEVKTLIQSLHQDK